MRILHVSLIAVVIVVALVGCFLLVNRPHVIAVEADLPPGFPPDGSSHDVFEGLLEEYVDGAGNVDYARWHGDPDARHGLDSYLAAVGRFSPENTPERFAARSDELAYWIYAYNAAVIKSVLDNWPLDSITSVKAPLEVVKGFGFFYQQRFLFGGTPLNLFDVENEKIRARYRDARIHFVLNCASESCPVLKPELPTGEALEPMLQQAAHDFVAETRNVRIDHQNEQVVLSTIFKWFRKDFINDLRRRGLPTDRGLVDYVASVGPESLRRELDDAAGYEVVFSEFDWGLNSRD